MYSWAKMLITDDVRGILIAVVNCISIAFLSTNIALYNENGPYNDTTTITSTTTG